MGRFGLPSADEIWVAVAPERAQPAAALSDADLLARLEGLSTETSDPAGAGRRAVSLEGCVLTCSILSDRERACASGRTWYRNDTIIDLRLVLTSPWVASVEQSRWDWESVRWPLRGDTPARRGDFYGAWRERSRAVIDPDAGMAANALAPRMDRLRALADEMFPERRFAGFSERWVYCDAGMLHVPVHVSASHDVRVALLPGGSGEEIIDLVHVHAQRHCKPR